MFKFRPYGDYLLLVPPVVADKTASGLIIIPDSYRKGANQGTIIDQGAGADAQQFQIGTQVVYKQHSEYQFTEDGKDLVIIHASDVILLCPPKPPDESAK